MATERMTDQTPLADWSHATDDIPEGGLVRERSVAADALADLAKALDMESLQLVKAAYRIQPLAGGAYRLAGQVSVKGEQRCVVSLEPIAAVIDEAFDVEFWQDLPERAGGEDLTILDERDVEKLEGGVIPVGRIVYETISASLDPYPRKEGAVFEWSEREAKSESNVSPFAELARLKNKP